MHEFDRLTGYLKRFFPTPKATEEALEEVLAEQPDTPKAEIFRQLTEGESRKGNTHMSGTRAGKDIGLPHTSRGMRPKGS